MGNTYLQNLLGDKEQILLVSRQHWLVLLAEITSELVLALALSTLISIVTVVLINPIFLLGLVLLLVPAASLTRDVLIWRNREFVITNRRVIQLSGVFSKNVSDSSLEKVNDVKMNQSFFGRIFDYGNIEILTASEMGINVIRMIAHPIRYKIAMVNAKEKLELGDVSPKPGAKDGDLLSLLSQLDALRQKGILTEAEFQEKKKAVLAQF
jgi:uncharacterized membrane protein YdbT with pleckstrin-like domain